MLGSFNNWNIITLLYKDTTLETFEKMNQVVLDGISENTASLVQYCKYGAMNTNDSTTVRYYGIEFVSKGKTLQ